jgi:hypothetical protein
LIAQAAATLGTDLRSLENLFPNLAQKGEKKDRKGQRQQNS